MGHRDINFTRSLYPTLIITLGYLLSFVVLNLLKKKLEPNLVIKSEQEINSTQDRLSLFVIRTGERWLNFWYQIWQYLSLGKGMVAVVFFLLGVGLARAGFLAYNKVQ